MQRSVALIACLAAAGLTPCALAQDTEVPVAQPASQSTNAPIALPVNPPDASTNAADVPPVTITNSPSQPVIVAPANQWDKVSPDGLVVTSPAAARFDTAMAFYNAGQYPDAVKAFSEFIGSFPQDRRREEALYRLAESYRNLGHADDAFAAYTFQVRNYPDGPLRINAELRRGAILFDQRKTTDALVPLQLVADKGDGELQQAANYLLGRALLASQKEADGRTLLQTIINQNPPGKYAGGAAQALAELDDTQNHFPEALALWQKAFALSTDPAVQSTVAARGGWSALQANQPAVAEKLFQSARQLNATGDTRKVANTGLLRLLFQQKRFGEWLAVYSAEDNLLLDSARSEILYDLGHTQFCLKHWSESATAFDQYLHEFGTQDAAVTAAYERFLAVTTLDKTRILPEAAAYLQAWPQSPYRARVQLLQAQELSAEKKFSESLPLWESLARESGDSSWPHQEILLELARTYDQLNHWPQAATAYQSYLDDVASHGGAKQQRDSRTLQAQARLAVCLQNSDQLLAATDAWKVVQSQAPDGSPEQRMALESLGLIYARGGPAQEAIAVKTFQILLKKYPQSQLRNMASFAVGDSLFKNHDYKGAEPFLLDARNWDAATWMQPATQRLVLGAYGMKDYNKTVAYVKEYDTLPAPTDPQAQIAARLPAAVFYWLGETARKTGHLDAAEAYYTRVTQHPDPGDLLAGAWWQLGEVQSQLRDWPAAVASYEQYRKLKPDAKDATVVLLALGRAQLGAKNDEAAKALGQQALLQEPEGPNSAAARMLLGEIAFDLRNFPEAARTFATLSVLFDDPRITPQAIARAADSFEQAGDTKSTAEWRKKLSDKYPRYQSAPYL
jgi:TolA-binding protein